MNVQGRPSALQIVVAALGVAVALLVAVQSTNKAEEFEPPAASPPAAARPIAPPPTAADPPPKPPGPSVTAPVVFDDPKSVAAAFAAAFLNRRFDDHSPRAWIGRVRPYITDPYHDRLVKTTTDAAGRGWHTFVDARSVQFARVTGTVIPAEAPRSPTRTWVYVYYDNVTQPESGASTTRREGASIEMVRVDGRWLVQNRTDGT